ncbi:MAG: histidine phosphatase family protein [Candidatus Thorarchaeota archaeon]
MGEENTWENLEWVYSAKKVLDWMTTIPENQPVMFLVRHSHRETLQNHDEMVSGGLTELGKRMSFELGRRIPRKGRMHIFTSFVPRCFETAEAIGEGFRHRGGEATDIDPLPTLVGPQIIEEDVWKNLHPDGRNVTDFVNTWVDGGFGERMEQFADYRSRLMDDTVKRLSHEQGNVVHIHVTHDLAMMSAKRILLKRPLESRDREPYLGGLGVTKNNDELFLYVAGETLPITL